MALQNILEEKVLPKVMAFVNTKTVQAVKDGFSATIGLTIIGSIFLIIAKLTIAGFRQNVANRSGDVRRHS